MARETESYTHLRMSTCQPTVDGNISSLGWASLQTDPPQVKLIGAALDPLGLPLSTEALAEP